MADWSELDVWWTGELERDPAYRAEVEPLVADLMDVRSGDVMLDLGTGSGWTLSEAASRGVVGLGVEINRSLAAAAAAHGSVVVGRLPDLDWCRAAAVDGVLAVLVLEHIDDLERLFAETFRIVRPGGSFTLVMNHPQVTAPGAAPVVDSVDGEVFWRWGSYLATGSTDEPADRQTVTFFHRPMGVFLTAAARAGWCVERVVEHGLPESQMGDDPLLQLQRGLPRLLGIRWRRA